MEIGKSLKRSGINCSIQCFGMKSNPDNWVMEDEDWNKKGMYITYYQAKIMCPHLLAFTMVHNHPEWVLKYKIWWWCADRRMVPIGDL